VNEAAADREKIECGLVDVSLVYMDIQVKVGTIPWVGQSETRMVKRVGDPVQNGEAVPNGPLLTFGIQWSPILSLL
jgi:hypothetical protein